MRSLLILLALAAAIPCLAQKSYFDLATHDATAGDFMSRPVGGLSYEYAEANSAAALSALPANTTAIKCRGVLDRDLKQIGRFKNLEALVVQGHMVRGAFLKELSGMRKLKVLHVTGGIVPAANLEPIGGLASLEDISIVCGNALTTIPSTTLSKIFGFRNLQYLAVPVALHGDALAGISRCKKLKGLGVVGHSPDAKEYQFKASPNITELLKIKNLQALHLQVSAEYKAVVEVINQQKDLTHLTLNLGNPDSVSLSPRKLKYLNLLGGTFGSCNLPALDVAIGAPSVRASWKDVLQSSSKLRVLCDFSMVAPSDSLDLELAGLEVLCVRQLPSAVPDGLKRTLEGKKLRVADIWSAGADSVVSLGAGGALEFLRIERVSSGRNRLSGPVVHAASRLTLRTLVGLQNSCSG